MLPNSSLCSKLDRILSPTTFLPSVNGSLSQEAEAANGVLHGSVWGPIFFAIYVNNLADNLTIENLPYATYVKLIAPRKQAPAFQSSLVTSSKCSEYWELILKPSNAYTTYPCTYSLISRSPSNAQPIQSISSVRDLGLLLNTGFSADNNVTRATKNA